MQRANKTMEKTVVEGFWFAAAWVLAAAKESKSEHLGYLMQDQFQDQKWNANATTETALSGDKAPSAFDRPH